jgi:Photosynthetic reaction centre cytochrome C subunit
MLIKKQLAITAGLFAVIIVSVAASLPQQQQREIPKLVNLKVFPKNTPYRVLDHEMDVWAASLGVHCNFCHARNDQTNKMDFASDAKPEKTTARHMFMMMGKINKKFFGAKKDTLGMIMTTGVNCNTCHHGTAHPEVKVPEEHRGPGGPPPGGAGGPPPGNPPGK